MSQRQPILIAGLLTTAIALLDWRVQPNISLGYLYIFPVLIAAGHLARWETVLLAAACASLREAFAPFPWGPEAVPRMALVMTAFAGAGLFVSEVARNRRLALLRLEAEEGLRVLVDTSPAAILTLDAQGRVLLANEAAQRLLGFDDRPLRGERIAPYLPALAKALQQGDGSRHFRTMVEERGLRRDGEIILTHIWFSTYETEAGPRLAAIVLDVSEDFRDRETVGLQSVMWTSRVLIGAVHHEIRNLCEAAAAAYTNLSRQPALAADEDFQALGTLAEGLKQTTSQHLRLSAQQTRAQVKLDAVLDALRIVLEPSFREAAAGLQWNLAGPLPDVYGEHHSLLQVFMNLAQNSLRAMEECKHKQLIVAAKAEDGRVAVLFEDSGPGVAHPERLFRPFQPDAEGAGLGLYVSRALVRSLGGDLRYEPVAAGARFTVELAVPVFEGKT